MKDALKSIKDITISRLNNPIIGAFVISWVMLNINGFSTFLLESSEGKLKIIQGKEWSLIYDLLIPFIISLFYLFLLPILNAIHEYITDGRINSWRSNRKKTFEIEKLQIHKAILSVKLETDEDYLKKLKEKDIEFWHDEKLLKDDEIQSLNYRVLELSKSVDKSVVEHRNLIKKNSSVALVLDEKEKELELVKNEASYILNEIEDHLKNIQNSNSLPSDLGNATTSYLKKISNTKVKLGLWDEKIPF